jgi:hypothetical protein
MAETSSTDYDDKERLTYRTTLVFELCIVKEKGVGQFKLFAGRRMPHENADGLRAAVFGENIADSETDPGAAGAEDCGCQI